MAAHRIAVISDVHADLHALQDALHAIDHLAVDQVVCCGDVVDYGLFPEETIALLRERTVSTIRGNHDRWATKRGAPGASSGMLSEEALAWIEALPTTWSTTIEGIRIVAWHASPRSDMKGVPADAPQHELRAMLDAEGGAHVLLVGHTHVPFMRRLASDAIVANPGAILRDGGSGVDVPTPGTFGILEVSYGHVAFEIRQVTRRARCS